MELFYGLFHRNFVRVAVNKAQERFIMFALSILAIWSSVRSPQCPSGPKLKNHCGMKRFPVDSLQQLGSNRWEYRRIADVDARWMTKAASADTRAATRIGRNVKDDVVRVRGITRHSSDGGQGIRCGHVVEPQCVTYAPSDIVVGTGSVAAHSDAADENMV